MKKVLKFAGSLIIGMCMGAAGVILGISWFTGTSLTAFLEHLKIETLLSSMFISLISLFIAGYLQIILHEAGHLLFGLATGYKFISFRIGKLTLIKEKGRFKIKYFKIPGTAGQCLLLPPDVSPQQLPFILYNLGGVLMNLFSAIVAILLLTTIPSIFTPLKLFLLFTALIGILFALLNGIPMKRSGIVNDGYNLRLMQKSLESRQALILQLKVNALFQEGTRLRDMPAEWFTGEDTEYSNPLLTGVKGFCVSRLIDQKEFAQAEKLSQEILAHREEVIPLFVLEAECELLFLELIGQCRSEVIEELYSTSLQQYISRFGETSTGKQRLQCALALLWEKDRKAAEEIYNSVCRKRNHYLMKAETEMDIELMEWTLQR